MSAYSIVPASVRHIRPMSARMRSAGSVALEGYGFHPRYALHRAFRSSIYCRTALVEGRPAAMWGVIGALLHDTAYVWLVLSEDIQRMPYAVVREARAELRRVVQSCPEIATTVLPDDEASIRFALHLGFRGVDGADDDIRINPNYRIPIGDSYVIQLRYHPTGKG